MSDSFTNWLGQTVAPGALVVYPAMSGRSCQMTEGEVLKVRLRTEEEARSKYERRLRYDVGKGERVPVDWRAHIGEPVSIRIQPTGRSSRWRQHYGKHFSGGSADDIRPVTLTANAGSVVVLQFPAPRPIRNP